MSDDKLFVVQIVMVHEKQWFHHADEPPIPSEREYYLEQYLFVAYDAEAAYRWADQLVKGNALTDSNNDLPPSGTNKYFPLGIHQLADVAMARDLGKSVHETYGLNLPNVLPREIDENGVPIVRRKEELDAFNPNLWHPQP